MSPTIEQRLAARDPGERRPVMFQSWRNLLFLHWKVGREHIQAMLPPGLSVDTFDGDAYVGIVPFFMCDVRPRFLPKLPGLSNFLELNVRTYVHAADGVPGVWFFSLDANCAPAVWAARSFFKLPYRRAKMRALVRDDGLVDYESSCRAGPYEGRFRYRENGSSCEADPASLEFFLLERYFLYAYDARRRRLLRGQVAHAPYRFCDAEVEQYDHGAMTMHGIVPQSSDTDFEFDHACVAGDVNVRIFGLERL